MTQWFYDDFESTNSASIFLRQSCKFRLQKNCHQLAEKLHSYILVRKNCSQLQKSLQFFPFLQINSRFFATWWQFQSVIQWQSFPAIPAPWMSFRWLPELDTRMVCRSAQILWLRSRLTFNKMTCLSVRWPSEKLFNFKLSSEWKNPLEENRGWKKWSKCYRYRDIV